MNPSEPGRASTAVLRNPQAANVTVSTPVRTAPAGTSHETPILAPTLSRPLTTAGSPDVGSVVSPLPTSPTVPSGTTSGKEGKDNLVDRISTLGRRGRIKQQREVTKLQEEGIRAFQQSMVAPTSSPLPPNFYIMDNNEERMMVEPSSMNQESVQTLVQTLLNWVNDELVQERILVRHLTDDFYDGQVLQKLISKLTKEDEVDHPEVTQSEVGQKQRLKSVLQCIERHLRVTPQWARKRWTMERIHAKDPVAILHLLVAMVRHFAPQVRLPQRVHLNVIIVRKRENRLEPSKEVIDIINDRESLAPTANQERDVIDTLFEKAPDRIQLLEQSLLKFVNTHLGPLKFGVVSELVSQFQDGVFLILLMGTLEGYFVPLYHYHPTPRTHEHKVANVNVALDLMEASGLPKPRDSPEDIVQGDRRAILRLLYSIFHRYQQEFMQNQQQQQQQEEMQYQEQLVQ